MHPGPAFIRDLALVLLVLPILLASATAFGATADASCSNALRTGQPYLKRQLVTRGTTPAQTPVTLTPGHEWLIEARERGNDAILEVQDSTGQLVAQADHPERRTGTRRIIFSPSDSRPLVLAVEGKEHQAVMGAVDLSVFDLATLTMSPACMSAYRSLAAADADYAAAQQISLGRINAPTEAAHDAYLRAAAQYLSAESLLCDPADAELRGEAALALAGVYYFNLQDWRTSAKWASSAQDLLIKRDPYRHARALAVAAAAWLEIATDATSRSSAADPTLDQKGLFEKARRTLRQLFLFHRRRQEWYDAALQINNIGLGYTYEGRFHECIVTSQAAILMFAKLHEAPRQGLAWQNSAVCHWGLGHLPEARGAFNEALRHLQVEPYPHLYVLLLNNTALINYALGHFDESLRLHDRALALAMRIQDRRAQAQSLYGIGVTYYALGDRAQAREFLERSLAVRSAGSDGRGRRANLRSLATIYADLGEYHQAIEFDRQGFALAAGPTSEALSRIPLAEHTALDGNPGEALEILAELIRPGTLTDPLVRAQARLQRATIERQAGTYAAALDDLASAIPVFERFASVTDAFYADLEHARVLRLMGEQAAALVAVDAALKRSESIRTQTANPEFRAQLQIPLRAAYDLKLDLLWDRFDAAAKAGKDREAESIAATAFRCADDARARFFAEIASQIYTPAVRRDLAGDLARRETLYRNLAGLRFSLDIRVDRSGSKDPRVKELQGEIAGVQREVDTLNTAIAARTADHRIKVTAPTEGSDGTALPMPKDAAIIAYWLGSESAYCWAVTPLGIHWTRLHGSAAITAAARAFHDSLTRLADVPRERRLETSAALYAEIIAPVDQWVAPYKRWFFIPDAALDYVPFAALRAGSRDGSPYIVMAHDIALGPAAWMLVSSRQQRRERPPAESRMLLVSDPVYQLSDPRLNLQHVAYGTSIDPPGLQSAPAYQRIEGTAREANAIQSAFSAPAVDAFSGFEATRARLLQLDWSRYRFIHIASHGHVDAQMPQLSSLILSGYDQRGQQIEDALRAADLSGLTLTADMVVFSGCDTALGKEVLNEGMVGLAYTTLARGAKVVISSLWQVPDEMGASLMTELYRHLVRDAMNPVTALSASMRSVLNRNASADPALWAVFQASAVTM